jgi:TonB family protein
VSTASKRWSLILSACAALTGCASPGYVTEHPVDNQISPLKAGVYSVEAVNVRPVATREIEPDYPPELGSILTGKAVVTFTVRTDGKVADASVVEADDVLFGEAAVAAVSKWRFRPAVIKGAPVDCRMTLPFAFTSPYGYYPGDESMPEPSDGAPPDGPHQRAIQPH